MAPPLRRIRKPLTKLQVIKGFGLFSGLIGTGLLGYRLFLFSPGYTPPKTNQQGQVIVVTNATAKLSRNMLEKLAASGARLVLTASDMDACQDERNRLVESTGISSVRVQCRHLVPESQTSVRRFAGSLLTDETRITRLVVLPPGGLSKTVPGERRLSPDAVEHQLASDYFSTYLLVRLLWPRLAATAAADSAKGGQGDARLVICVDVEAAARGAEAAPRSTVSEEGAEALPLLPTANFNWERGYDPDAARNRAQWYLRLFADELCARQTESGVSVVVADSSVRSSTSPEEQAELLRYSGVTLALRTFYNLLLEFSVNVLPRRSLSTCLKCALAPLDTLSTCFKAAVSSPPAPVSSNSQRPTAPLFRDMAPILREQDPDPGYRPDASAQLIDQLATNRRHLWAISEHWTHLDTHPSATPLPLRRKTVPEAGGETMICPVERKVSGQGLPA